MKLHLFITLILTSVIVFIVNPPAGASPNRQSVMLTPINSTIIAQPIVEQPQVNTTKSSKVEPPAYDVTLIGLAISTIAVTIAVMVLLLL